MASKHVELILSYLDNIQIISYDQVHRPVAPQTQQKSNVEIPEQVHIREPWFSHIESGRKTYEGRLFWKFWAKLSVGDIISVTNDVKCMKIQITNVLMFDTFEVAYENLGETLLPGVKSSKDAGKIYRQFYSDAEVSKFGAACFGVKVIIEEKSPIPTMQQCNDEVTANRVRRKESQCGNFALFAHKEMVAIQKTWNNVNLWCRGLIFDKNTKKPVAVPYKKFFNVDQVPETSTDVLREKGFPIRVADKLDGSLGIIFYDKYAEKIVVTTKGSFDSGQAIWATEYINNTDNYKSTDEFQSFVSCLKNEPYTPLVEIIYPSNKIVLTYDFSGLVYHGSVHKASGLPSFLPDTFPSNWRLGKLLDPRDIDSLMVSGKSLPGTSEGYVLTFADGLMAKIKGDEYLQMHRMMSSCNAKLIHKMMKENASEADYAEFPDEFFDSIQKTRKVLLERYMDVLAPIRVDVEECKKICESKKEQAMWAKKRYADERNKFGYFFSLMKGEDPVRAWNEVKHDDLEIEANFEDKQAEKK